MHDDGQVGEVSGDVVEEHRVGVAQLDAASAGEAGADAGLPGVEQRGDAEFGESLVERVAAVVGLECLKAGVELEATYAVSVTSRRAAVIAACPACGSTEPKGISTSACSAAWSAISSLERAGWPVAAAASTVNTTAAMRRAR